jgi:hypothetical protein
VVQRRKDEERKVFMKKVALALVVLAFTVPAMAAVTITSSLGTGVDANKVTIGYSTTGGDEVRAFALNVKVSDKAFDVNSVRPVGDPNHTDYWVFPGSMTFTVNGDGNTVVANFGNPMAERDPNGGVVEMASLYATNDPCHPSLPASSGSLCTFKFKRSPCGPDNKITVDVNTPNTKRGGVVLKDPNATASVTWPAQLVYPCGTPTPPCWACPGQPYGDANGDGTVSSKDLALLRKSWLMGISDPHGTGVGQYNCCADFNHDNIVSSKDLAKLRQNWLGTFGVCGDISCP